MQLVEQRFPERFASPPGLPHWTPRGPRPDATLQAPVCAGTQSAASPTAAGRRALHRERDRQLGGPRRHRYGDASIVPIEGADGGRVCSSSQHRPPTTRDRRVAPSPLTQRRRPVAASKLAPTRAATMRSSRSSGRAGTDMCPTPRRRSRRPRRRDRHWTAFDGRPPAAAALTTTPARTLPGGPASPDPARQRAGSRHRRSR